MNGDPAVEIARVIKVAERRFSHSVIFPEYLEVPACGVCLLPHTVVEILLLIARRDRYYLLDDAIVANIKKNLSAYIDLDMGRAVVVFGRRLLSIFEELDVGGTHHARPLAALDLLKGENRLSGRVVRSTVDFGDPIAKIIQSLLDLEHVYLLFLSKNRRGRRRDQKRSR